MISWIKNYNPCHQSSPFLLDGHQGAEGYIPVSVPATVVSLQPGGKGILVMPEGVHVLSYILDGKSDSVIVVIAEDPGQLVRFKTSCGHHIGDVYRLHPFEPFRCSGGLYLDGDIVQDFHGHQSSSPRSFRYLFLASMAKVLPL